MARPAAARRWWHAVAGGVIASAAAMAIAQPDAGGPAIAADAGLRAVEGIQPPTVALGPAGGAARQCLRVVEVTDSALACRAQACTKLFPSRRTKALADGQRALLAGPCDGPGRTLLWGSSSLLVLQPARVGEGLWAPRTQGGRATVDIETEGSHGTLELAPAGFAWKEHAN